MREGGCSPALGWVYTSLVLHLSPYLCRESLGREMGKTEGNNRGGEGEKREEDVRGNRGKEGGVQSIHWTFKVT